MKFSNFLLIGLISSLILNTGCNANVESPVEEDASLKNEVRGQFTHSVYFWLVNPDSPEDRTEFEAAVKKFIDGSAYVRTKYLGTPAGTPRDVVDNTWTYNLIVTFDSKADHELYQAEQVHEVFRNESAHLWSRVLIYDGLKIW